MREMPLTRQYMEHNRIVDALFEEGYAIFATVDDFSYHPTFFFVHITSGQVMHRIELDEYVWDSSQLEQAGEDYFHDQERRVSLWVRDSRENAHMVHVGFRNLHLVPGWLAQRRESRAY